MVLIETKLKVADNYGIFVVKCIKIFSKNRVCGNIGDYIMVSVQKKDFNKLPNIKKIFLAIILTTKKIFFRKSGYSIKFNENRVLILSSKDDFIATRLLGPITFEATQKNIQKLLSVAKKCL